MEIKNNQFVIAYLIRITQNFLRIILRKLTLLLLLQHLILALLIDIGQLSKIILMGKT